MRTGPAGAFGTTGTNHLPGKHDQSSHGRRRGLRPELAKAKTVEEVAAILAERGSQLVGDTVTADLTGVDLETARQFSEGLLVGMERYPAAPLREVGSYGPGGSNTANARLANRSPHEVGAVAFALRGGESNGAGDIYQVPSARLRNGTFTTGTAIYVNAGAATPEYWTRRARIRELETSGVLSGRSSVTVTARAVALHEFAHSVGTHGRPSQPEYQVGRTAARRAADAGQDVRTFVSRQVSHYAATDDAELAAEVFADAMTNGSKVSSTTKELFEVFEANVRGWEAEVNGP